MKSRWSMPHYQESIPLSLLKRNSMSYGPRSPLSWTLRVSMMIYRWSWKALKQSMRPCPYLEYKNQSAQNYSPLWPNGALWSKTCKARQISISNVSLCLIKIKCRQEHNNPLQSQACSLKLAQGPMLTSSCICKPLDSQNKHHRRCLRRRLRRKRRICSISTHHYFSNNSQRNLVQFKFPSSSLLIQSEWSGEFAWTNF